MLTASVVSSLVEDAHSLFRVATIPAFLRLQILFLLVIFVRTCIVRDVLGLIIF